MTFKITSPIEGYTGRSVFGSATVEFRDGVAETDEKLPDGLKAYLKGRGYKVEKAKDEQDGPFDPSKHNVAEVRTYLDELSHDDPDARDAEVARVIEAERAGKNRASLLESIGGVPSAPETGDQGGAGQTGGGDA